MGVRRRRGSRRVGAIGHELLKGLATAMRDSFFYSEPSRYTISMGLPERVNEQTYSYADYLSWPEWPEGERYELIHGEAFAMSPAPRLVHQTISGEIQRQIGNALKDSPCRVLAAPTVNASSACTNSMASPSTGLLTSTNESWKPTYGIPLPACFGASTPTVPGIR